MPYARYTELTFAPEKAVEVEAFWADASVRLPARQEGFISSTVLRSQEKDALRVVTVWKTKEDFDRYYAEAEHEAFIARLKALGIAIVERDGLDVLQSFGSERSLVRVLNTRIDRAHGAALEEFWKTTGGPFVRAQPGCLAAEAFWSVDGTFGMIVEWADEAANLRFTKGPDHDVFLAGLNPALIEVSQRQSWRRIG